MGKFLSGEIIDDPKLNALGAWCDEHRAEIDAECEEAERNGETYTLEELGADDYVEAAKIMREMQANGTFGKFRTPYHAKEEQLQRKTA